MDGSETVGDNANTDWDCARFYSRALTATEIAANHANDVAKYGSVIVWKDCSLLGELLAYMGWINATNTYQMYLAYIKPYVNIQKCKRIVSKHDKKEALKYAA